MQTAAASGAAAAQMVAQAIKASGAIVSLNPREFQKILKRNEEGLVVCSTAGVFSTKYIYLTGYKGMVFHTKSSEPLHIPSKYEVIEANTVWIP